MHHPVVLRAPRALAVGRLTTADTPESAAQPEKISATTHQVSAAETLALSLAPAGGHGAEPSPQP